MRSTIITALLGLSLVAGCEVGDAGGGGGGGGGGGAGGGGGGGGDLVDASQVSPRVQIAVDKSTMTTDLTVENTMVVTATSQNGFAGNVTLTATAVDASGAPLVGWGATLGTATLSLAAGASGTANLKLKVLANAPTLTGSVKITATSAAGPVEASVAVTANPVVLVVFSEVGGKCSYPAYPVNNRLKVKAGRMIKVMNNTTQPMTIHVDAGIAGFSHEGGVIANGQTYNGMPTTAGDVGTFYCHSGNNPVTITDAQGAIRPTLEVE